MKGSWIFIGCIFFLVACDKSRVFDKNLEISNAEWYYDQPKIFTVTIQDTASTYNMFVNVRHTDAYGFNNLLLKVKTIFPDSTIQHDNVNVILAENNGQWTGSCIDNVCFNSILVRTAFTFPEPGTYTFELEQDMRLNPVMEIMDVGVKMEKFAIK